MLALGDSFVEGYTVSLAETVSQVLETRLTVAGRPVEVVNGGTLAYSSDQEYLFYKEEGRRYGARIVLLFFYYNDVLYNRRPNYFGRPKPLLDVTDGEPRLRRYPVPRAAVPNVAEARAETPRGSALLRWVGGHVEARAPQLYDRLAPWGLWPEHTRRRARLELRVYESSPEPELEPAWTTTAGVLTALRREVEQDGAQLVVVYVPSRLEVHDDAWAGSLRAYLGSERWSRQAVVARLRRLAQRGGYGLIDLTPALRQVDRGWGQRPYFITDGHWTALGHRTAASAVHEALVAQGYLSHCP